MNATLSTDLIRDTVFKMNDKFTAMDVVRVIVKDNKDMKVNSFEVNSYLDKISKAGVLTRSGKVYWIESFEHI